MDGIRELVQPGVARRIEVILEREAKLPAIPNAPRLGVPGTVAELFLDQLRSSGALGGRETIAREFCSKHSAPNGSALSRANPHAEE